MKCQFCGQDLPYGTQVCPKCGQPVPQANPNNQGAMPPKKNGTLIAIIIAIIVVVAIVVGLVFLMNNNSEDESNSEGNNVVDKDKNKETDIDNKQYDEYIEKTNKDSLINTLMMYIKETTTKVNEGLSYLIFSTDEIVMIPVGENSCVQLDTPRVSPFSSEWNYAYVAVVFNGMGYNYFMIAEDGNQNGIKFVNSKALVDDGADLIYRNGSGRNNEISNYLINQYAITSNDTHTMTALEKEMFSELLNNYDKYNIEAGTTINKVIYVSPKVCKHP